MKDYIEAEVKEDSIIFSLNELANRTPRNEMKQDLENYIASLQQMEQQEDDIRVVEIEERYSEFARFIIDTINAGKELPQYKSYSLNN